MFLTLAVSLYPESQFFFLPGFRSPFCFAAGGFVPKRGMLAGCSHSQSFFLFLSTLLGGRFITAGLLSCIAGFARTLLYLIWDTF